ncbi:MAG: hypothetical protein EP329_17280 [Deltaproteobacteria bacterium]|nr:MAG: hypothetical protein EP329_17280 [Deltaproteobacteria bacterium]
MTLGAAAERLLDTVAAEADAELGVHAEAARWQPHRYDVETAPTATLHLDDVSGVPFLQDIVGVQFYQLRTRVRAGDGDGYVAACPGMDDYERYCSDRLGLGAPRFFQADPVGPAIEVAAACRQGRVFDELVAWAREAGGLTVHPYMGIEAVWELAADLARAARVPVQVLGPTPPATWYANDKSHVTALADRAVAPTLGTPANVATRVVTTPAEMVTAVRELSRSYPKVALKMTRFASAMGNRVFDAAELRALDDEQLADVVATYLRDKAWRPGQPVLAVRWIDMAPSPSTQLWIPPLGQGRPRLDGIYEQLLEGPERVFLGSIPSRFGADVHRWLEDASLLMAGVYQRLGYVGRCSFDFILDGEQPLFVECNGRWGGTSTPMHLVDRLFPSGRPAYRARDFVSERFVGASFTALADALGDALYDPRTGRGRFVLYNVGCLAFGKFDVIALGADIDDATRALEVELPRLLG